VEIGMLRPLQAFIFDLDGVITDTAEYHYLAWKALGEELGIPFTREFNEELKGVSRMDSLEKILTLGQKQNEFSEQEKIALATKKNEHYVRLIANITPDDILPGIKELIADIKEKGYKLGLASVSKNAFTVMESLKLRNEFDVIVDAAKVAKGKPDPEIFLTAAKLLQVEPSACIGIEDAAAGVESIKGAGMFAVGVGNSETLAKADIIYASTNELSLPEILKAYQL
jgi:beta-phosphoglucomutase